MPHADETAMSNDFKPTPRAVLLKMRDALDLARDSADIDIEGILSDAIIALTRLQQDRDAAAMRAKLEAQS